MKVTRNVNIRVFLFIMSFTLCINQELLSPCPSVFNINPNSVDVGTWGGTLQLNLEKDIQGLFLQIDLDNKIDLIYNNFGMITTKNNQKYMLEDFYYTQKKDRTRIKFSVKYNAADPAPQVKTIYVNGILKCPEINVRIEKHIPIPFIDIEE